MGPAALDIVLPQLPAEFSLARLVAQHMPASFTGPFAKRLDRQCALQVVEVNRPMPLRAGHGLYRPGRCRSDRGSPRGRH